MALFHAWFLALVPTYLPTESALVPAVGIGFIRSMYVKLVKGHGSYNTTLKY